MGGISSNLYLRVLGIGAVSGLRSLTAPALVSAVAAWGGIRRSDRAALYSLASPAVAGTLCVLAAGELIADKLPITPDRTVPGSVVFRAVSGAVVGAALCAEAGKSRTAGAALGMLGAVAATYGAYYLRQSVDRRSGLPDFVVALVEDAVAIGGGLSAIPR